jgi:hypothetical protein
MPRYFFNFESEHSSTADLVGRELPDDQAGRDHQHGRARQIA